MNKEELVRKINNTLQHYPYVLKAELFGSQQSGKATSISDIDIIVQFDPNTRPKGIAVYEVELELEDKLGIPVDLVQEHLLHDFVRIGIGSERELIYEKPHSTT